MTDDYWSKDIVNRLLERASLARHEETGTATADAVHFEQAAKEIERLRSAIAATWHPISKADKDIAYIHDLGELRIGNSYPIWARDADGRVFECLWADDGKRAYWWDIEGESPVDPVEFMPHPLATKS
jgi:hypothetical protein